MASTVTEKKPATEPTLTPSLPDELVLSCLARVSRSHYPSLSLVSKSFRSIITSPELYRNRSVLKCTETCLYVCLQFPPDPNPHWFTLYTKHNKTLTSKNEENESSFHLLVPISNLNSPQVEKSDFVAVDHKLYVICKPIEAFDVSFLDCRTHTWLKASSLRLAHTGSSDLDRSIYLPGSYEKVESLNCVEMFNTKTQTWELMQPKKLNFVPRVMEGKVYFTHHNTALALNPKNRTWELLGRLVPPWDWASVCSIGDIRFSYFPSEKFQWSYFGRLQVKRKLEGLEGLPDFADYRSVILANYCGKLVVLWDKSLPGSSECKEKMIWCAVISLEKRSSENIRGKVEWVDAVLKVPESFKFVYAIGVTF